MEKTTLDSEMVTQLLVDLVRIDSVNPALVPGAAGEGDIAAYVGNVLEGAGAAVTYLDHGAGRKSVVGLVAGRGGGRTLMLNAHLDTVGVDGMVDPFGASMRDGRLYGRGAYDMKGSLAACLAAARVIAADPLAGDVVVAGVADEEHASLGTFAVAEQFPVDGAVVTEPSQLEICRAHKGFVWTEIETVGRAAHGSQPHLGVDANLRMGRILTALAELERELRERRSAHPLVGVPSLHAALLAGGSGLSTYAASSRVSVERRTIPGESVEHAVGEQQALLDELIRADPDLEVSLRILLHRAPFEVAEDAPIVRALERATETVLGTVPAHRGENPWMDSAILSERGVETVVFGPIGGGAHAAEEWVDLDSVVRLAAVLVETAKNYCV